MSTALKFNLQLTYKRNQDKVKYPIPRSKVISFDSFMKSSTVLCHNFNKLNNNNDRLTAFDPGQPG